MGHGWGYPTVSSLLFGLSSEFGRLGVMLDRRVVLAELIPHGPTKVVPELCSPLCTRNVHAYLMAICAISRELDYVRS